MTKEEYISKQYKLIDDSFSQTYRYKLIFLKERDREEQAKCINCQNTNFYSFRDLIVCSNCFTDHTYNHDNCYLI